MFIHYPFTQTVGTETLAATITRPAATPESPPTILIIHGAGPSSQHRYTMLAEHLTAQGGHTSLRFDHSGHGQSSGELINSSLIKRLNEARSFLPLLHPTAPLTVMGASMGGHIAAQLLPHGNFQTLITQVPAAYTQAAENTTFGETFSSLIRTPGSWEDAAIWPKLEAFTGTFLLISAENDPIIPQPVLRSYWHHARNSSRRSHLFLPQAEHSLSGWLDKNPQILPSYFQAICSTFPQ